MVQKMIMLLRRLFRKRGQEIYVNWPVSQPYILDSSRLILSVRRSEK